MRMRRGTPVPTTGPSVGVISLACQLAGERHNGLKLKDLDKQQQQDLYAEATAMLERYVRQ